MTASKGKELRYIHLGFALAAGPKAVIAFGFSSVGHRRDLPAGAELSLDKWFRKGKFRKAKGRFLFRDLAPAFRIFEDLVRAQITTTRHFRAFRDVQAGPAVSRTPSSHFAVRAFLFRSRQPVAWMLA